MEKTETGVNITRFGKKTEFEVLKGNKSKKHNSRFAEDGTKGEDAGLGIEEMKYEEGKAAMNGTEKGNKGSRRKQR